jgi:hypothetical protein
MPPVGHQARAGEFRQDPLPVRVRGKSRGPRLSPERDEHVVHGRGLALAEGARLGRGGGGGEVVLHERTDALRAGGSKANPSHA